MTSAAKPVTRVTTPSSAAAGVLDADVAVIGAGPAGIAAAARAAEAGRRVVVIDEAPNVGGQIWRHRARATLGGDARRWLDRLGRTQAQVVRGLAVIDVTTAPDRGGFTIVAERHRGGVEVVRAMALVLATGARERFLPFPGWTLPGVVGIGGAQALLKQGATVRGKRVVIAGSGPLLLPVAASLAGAGARLRLVAEQAPSAAVRDFALSLVSHPDTMVQAALYRLAFIGTAYALGTWVTEARGGDRLTSVMVSDGRTSRAVACDVLCTGYGLVPNVELARLMGCAVSDGTVTVNSRQETTIAGVFAAGEVTGVGGVALALVEGEIAGAAAARVDRADPSLVRRRQALRVMANRLARTFAVRREIAALARDDTIICRCEDVRRGAIAALGDARQAKLYERAGMGACQGRVCGPALETLFGWEAGTVRPPLEPVRLSTLSVAAAAVGGAVTSSGTVNSSPGA
jgi:NADPH-dependent 2,4-dienoyl-CoA reductase/sulfur reductase-like enzyme